MKANDILNLLKTRHSKDVFVSECKNGPSYCGGLMRLDAWVMAKSWAHPKLTAYEIKVSRQDFLHDDKWRASLGLCNEFYWAVPPGIIDPSEVSPECGLLVTSVNGKALYCKKRAQYREIEDPNDVFRYVLMCRASIGRERDSESPAEFWRRWLDERDEKKSLGQIVSKKVREVIRTRIDNVASENNDLRRVISDFNYVLPILQKYGIVDTLTSDRGDIVRPSCFRYGWLEDKLRKAREAVPDELLTSLRSTLRNLEELKSREIEEQEEAC